MTFMKGRVIGTDLIPLLLSPFCNVTLTLQVIRRHITNLNDLAKTDYIYVRLMLPL